MLHLRHITKPSKVYLSKHVLRTFCVAGYKLLESAEANLFTHKDFTAAMHDLQQFHNLPKSNEALSYSAGVYSGLCHKLQGNESEAEKNFLLTLAEHPNCKYSHMGLSELYHANGDMDKAFHHVLEALRISPKYFRARLLLSNILLYQYHQYELSVSHLEAALNQSLEHFYNREAFDLHSDMQNDLCTLPEQDSNSISHENVLMNCPSLLYKSSRDYEDENSFYYRSMLDSTSVAQYKENPHIVIDTEPFCDLGVKVPGSRIISTKISESSVTLLNACSATPQQVLSKIISFADQIENDNQITVLVSDECAQHFPPEQTETAPDASTKDDIAVWSKWMQICKPMKGWWDLVPRTEMQESVSVPESWKVYSEGQFLRGGSYVYDHVKEKTPLLQKASCNQCGSTVSGLLATNLAYSPNYASAKCKKCKEGVYLPHHAMPSEKQHVELTLLEKIVTDIWNSDALIVVGSLAKVHPWIDLVDVAVTKQIPIGMFNSPHPRQIPKDLLYSIPSDPLPSLSHFIKERHHALTHRKE